MRHFLIWYSTAPPRVWCYHCVKYLSYSVWRQKSSYVAPAEQNFSDGRSSSCQRTVNISALLQWHNDKQLCPRTCSKIHHTFWQFKTFHQRYEMFGDSMPPFLYELKSERKRVLISCDLRTRKKFKFNRRKMTSSPERASAVLYQKSISQKRKKKNT